MNISVGVVTYNSEKEVSTVLKSLLSCDIEDLAIYVIDNASKDKTAEIIRKNFPDVNLQVLEKNIGFGAAHNKIIDLVKSDYHIIVNPDISIEATELNKMIDYMNSNPETVILSPRVLNMDGSEQFVPRCVPCFKYALSGLLEKHGKYFFDIRSEYTLRDQIIKEPIEIFFCTGCFMFCRTSALKQCGGFDERYFLYCEDADLTLKMKKNGKTVYDPNVYVYHLWKQGSRKNFKSFFIHLKSLFLFCRKWKKH